jgi:TRAP-type mannitol/chloroaromatic compound transport system permease small subunit
MHSILKLAVKPLSRVTNGIAIAANTAGTLVVLLLVLAVDYDVIARGLFNKPFMGAVEVVQFSMVLIVFLQLPDVIRVNRLTRSEGFLIVMEPRFPTLIRLVRRIIDGVSSFLMVLIAIAIWPEFLDMLESKDYFGVPGVFTAPWWPIKLIIFLSAVLCALILIFKVILGEEKVHLPKSNDNAGAAS